MEEIHSPYENFLNVYIADKKEGYCKIGLPYRREVTNPHANFHGGVITSIVDTAVVQGLRTVFPKGPYLTVDLKIRYKKPSKSAEIFAEARPRHLKGKFFVTEVKVTDKENQLVAEAQVKSFLPDWEQKERGG